jgi:hypothetical protein
VIRIDNDGPRLAGTNYFETEQAHAGNVFVSTNAGAFRLLVPRGARGWLDEMRGADYLIVTRGQWTPAPMRLPDNTVRQQHPREALELLFEDGSDSPFVLHVGAESVDRLPSRQDDGRTHLRCLVYTEGPTLELEIPARFRRAARLPHLKPWVER